MHERRLGTTDLVVPAVGMGTWRTFDVRGAAEEEYRRRIVDSALGGGARLFDSSPMYGEAERVLRAALAGRRHEAIVATKIWTSSRAAGRRQIEGSLRYFEGYIDIYQIHNLVAWREHLPVLETLRTEGKIGIIGATHYSHAAFPELLEVVATGRVQQIQIPYNALDRAVEREVLAAAADRGIGVLVMRPFGEGALLRRPPSPERLAPLLAFGVGTWPQALLKWILSEPRIHSVLPATSKVHRVTENAAAGDPPWLDAEARRLVSDLADG